MWTPFAEALGQNRCGMLLGIRGSMEAGADAAGRQGGRHDGGGPGPWTFPDLPHSGALLLQGHPCFFGQTQGPEPQG